MMFQALKAAAQQQGGSPFTNDYRDACLASGAVGLWMLDETSGTAAVDQGTAGVNGVYVGDLATSGSRGHRSAFNIPLAGAPVADSGTSGKGFRGGMVYIPSDSAFVTQVQPVTGGAMSYEFVSVKDYEVPGSYQYWLMHYKSASSPNQGPMSYLREHTDNSTSKQSWTYQNNSGSNYSVYGQSPSKQALGVATHNVVTMSTTSSQDYLRWYRNGVRVANWYQAGMAQINGGAADINIGGLSNSSSSLWASYGLHGAIGGVAAYDYALSQTDVTTHYNALLT